MVKCAQIVLQTRLVVSTIPTREIKYLFIFSFLHSDVEAKRGVEFRHLMPPEFGGKWETEYFKTRFSLSTLLCVGYSVKLKKKENV